MDIVSKHLEMLVFDDASVRYIGIGEVHDGITLVVGHVKRFMFETYTTPLQLSEAIIKVFVNFASVQNMFSNALPILTILEEVGVDTRFNTLEQTVNELVESPHGNALEAVAEIVIVVNKTDGKTLDNKCRQIRAFTSPLLLCIAFNQCFVNVFTY